MATATKTTARPVAKAARLGGTGFYATPTGFKKGTAGRVNAPGFVYAGMSRGDARRLRKAAHAAGFVNHAAASRVNPF